MRRYQELDVARPAIFNEVIPILKQGQRIAPVAIVHLCKRLRECTIEHFLSGHPDFSRRQAKDVDRNQWPLDMSRFIVVVDVVEV